MPLFSFFVGAVVMAMLVFIAYRMVQDTPDRAELERLRTRDADWREAVDHGREKAQALETLQIAHARLAADLENEQRVSAEKLQLLQTSEMRLKTEFENLANRIFEDRGRSLNDQNRERIASLLQPFKEQLDGFRRRVDEVHQRDTEQSTRLIEQVRQLHALSNRVSDEANNLASAIKGGSKTQGDWGELIVERMLEAAGLERGREYDTQVALRSDEDGSLKKPDFIIRLPGDKAVILDAKVSLTAYERYCNGAEESARAEALAGHVRSVRLHIEELCRKNYHELLGNRTLDFVIMCIPLEPAYQAALQADTNLIYDLARTGVVITGPATLMITLKLIAQIWRREHENRHAEIIADRAGRMHDQIVLVYEAMSDARRRLGGTAEAFDLAMRRLCEGRGNLISRGDQLRRLGAKTGKTLPGEALERALVDETDTDDEPDGIRTT